MHAPAEGECNRCAGCEGKCRLRQSERPAEMGPRLDDQAEQRAARDLPFVLEHPEGAGDRERCEQAEDDRGQHGGSCEGAPGSWSEQEHRQPEHPPELESGRGADERARL